MSFWNDAIGLFTSNKAAKKQEAATHAASVRSEAATKESIAQNENMYGIGMAQQQPYLDGGLKGQNRLMELMGLGGDANSQNYGALSKQFGAGDFNADPGYQWRLAQGQKGIDRSMAARGGLLSGAAVKASADYNQGMASQEYGNAYNRFNQDQNSQFNRLSGIIGTGQHAADYAGNLGSNLSSNNANLRSGNALNVGNNLIQGANARAAGYMAQGRFAGNLANQATDYMKSPMKFGV
jgi:hypothetical protein